MMHKFLPAVNRARWPGGRAVALGPQPRTAATSDPARAMPGQKAALLQRKRRNAGCTQPY